MSVFKEVSLRWLVGVMVHLILLQCAFELRREPEWKVVDGLRSAGAGTHSGPAKRVVLTVIGGLTFDAYRAKATTQLYKKLNSRGVNGASVTSARCHLSGLMEMFTGIPGAGQAKRKNVETVFSHLKVLYIGPPSVQVLSDGKWVTISYKVEWENPKIFPYPRLLNEWVISNLESLLNEKNNSCSNLIHESELILIYLPGVDVSYHLHGPASSYSSDELSITMDSLKRLFEMLEKRDDSKTAFILTSSHGFMEASPSFENVNSNGVKLPFTTWGAGFSNSSEPSADKDLPQGKTNEVRTHDIAPLVSSLLGAPIPANSFGVTPLYCLENNKLRARLSLSNARQMSKLFETFGKKLSYGLAAYMSPVQSSHVRRMITTVENTVISEDYEKAIGLSQELIDVLREGIIHYSEFRFRNTATCVLLSLVGWLAVTAGWVVGKVKITPLIQRELLPPPETSSPECSPKLKRPCFKLLLTPKCIVDFCGGLVILGVLGISVYFSAPFPVVSSTFLTAFVSWLLFREIFHWTKLVKSTAGEPFQGSAHKPLMHLIFFILFTMILDYPILINVFVLSGIVFSCLTDLRRKPKPYPTFWTLSCIPFSILVHYNSGIMSFSMLLFGTLVWVSVILLSMYLCKANWFDWPLVLIGTFLTCLNTFLGFPSTWAGVLAAWSPLTLASFIPLIGSPSLPIRLLQVCCCLCAHISLLALDFEIIALFLILVHMFSWLLTEGFTGINEFVATGLESSNESNDAKIVWSDFRCCIYYLGYVITSFLAMGNSLDINSWSKSWPVCSCKTSLVRTFFFVSLKTVPIIVLINMTISIIGRKHPSGYLAVKLFLGALVSFFQFLLKGDLSSNICLNFILLLSLLAEPISRLLLCPSLFSKLTKMSGVPVGETKSCIQIPQEKQ